MTTNQSIEAKRAELRELKRQEDTLRSELYALFTQHAIDTCPIQLGTKVEYEDHRFGLVDTIGFYREWDELEPNKAVHWVVSGKKFNKDGQFGKKNFHPVGPATHFLHGTRFKAKGIAGTLGISEYDF